MVAFLFGSAAAGRAHRESDVDVAVLFDIARLPTAERRFTERLRLAHRLALHFGTDAIDLVVLNDASTLIRRAVLRSGSRFFASSTRAALDFERDTQLLAADLAPFVECTRRLNLAALAR